jgi:hypothetical protein
MRNTRTHLLRVLPFALVFAVVFGGTTPAHAQAYKCTQDLRDCYYRAAAIDSWWSGFFMAIDCELSATDCYRRALIGR